MEHTTKFYLSREYMSESYDQARRYGTKWLLVERIIGTGFILLGLALYIYVNGEMVLPLALVAVGVIELMSNNIKKYFWLRRHSKSKLMGAEVEIKLTDAGIDSCGPFSAGHFNWEGMEKAVRTHFGRKKGCIGICPRILRGERPLNSFSQRLPNKENRSRDLKSGAAHLQG